MENPQNTKKSRNFYGYFPSQVRILVTDHRKSPISDPESQPGVWSASK